MTDTGKIILEAPARQEIVDELINLLERPEMYVGSLSYQHCTISLLLIIETSLYLGFGYQLLEHFRKDFIRPKFDFDGNGTYQFLRTKGREREPISGEKFISLCLDWLKESPIKSWVMISLLNKNR